MNVWVSGGGWGVEPAITVTDRNVPTWAHSDWVPPIRNQTPSNVAWEILMANRLVNELPQLFNSPLIWPTVADAQFMLQKEEIHSLYTAAGGLQRCMRWSDTVHILKCNYTEARCRQSSKQVASREWPSESKLFHQLLTRCQRSKLKYESSTCLGYGIRYI